jgi:hypothetical protein
MGGVSEAAQRRWESEFGCRGIAGCTSRVTHLPRSGGKSTAQRCLLNARAVGRLAVTAGSGRLQKLKEAVEALDNNVYSNFSFPTAHHNCYNDTLAYNPKNLLANNNNCIPIVGECSYAACKADEPGSEAVEADKVDLPKVAGLSKVLLFWNADFAQFV